MFKYGLMFRPASIGAVPKGFTAVEPSIDTPEAELGRRVSRHGVIVYPEPLPEHLVANFELVLLADETVVEMAAAFVVRELRQYREAYLEQAHSQWDRFEARVMQALDAFRKHQVYVGEPQSFARKVVELLSPPDLDFNYQLMVDSKMFFTGDESSIGILMGNLDGRNWTDKILPVHEFKGWRGYMEQTYNTLLPIGAEIEIRSPEGILLERSRIGASLSDELSQAGKAQAAA